MRSGYKMIGPLAYQGKEGCQDIRCTRRDVRAYAEGDDSGCMGWHCSYCDAPCSSQGHRCDASQAILAESKRIIDAEREADPGAA